MNRVHIVGSAPGSKVESDADFYYFSNASAGYHKFKNESCRAININSVVSASELNFISSRNNTEKLEWIRRRRELIAGYGGERIILLFDEIYPGGIKCLRDLGFTGEIQCISQNCLSKLSHKWSSISYPVNPRYFDPAARIKWRILFYVDILKSQFNKDHVSKGLFRPSTGLIALLVALNEHGESANYSVTGLSFTARGQYLDGFNNTWSGPDRLADFHVHADRVLLDELRKRYSISVENLC